MAQTFQGYYDVSQKTTTTINTTTTITTITTTINTTTTTTTTTTTITTTTAGAFFGRRTILVPKEMGFVAHSPLVTLNQKNRNICIIQSRLIIPCNTYI